MISLRSCRRRTAARTPATCEGLAPNRPTPSRPATCSERNQGSVRSMRGANSLDGLGLADNDQMPKTERSIELEGVT